MKEMGIPSEQTDHLLRYEIIFFICCISAAFSILCFYYYVHFYVDGSAVAKSAIYIGFILIMGNQLFLSATVAVFYVAIQIEFSLLNEYFRWKYHFFSYFYNSNPIEIIISFDLVTLLYRHVCHQLSHRESHSNWPGFMILCVSYSPRFAIIQQWW